MIDLNIDTSRITIDPWKEKLFEHQHIKADVLRLDKIHPVISGNKWFKLQPYLEKALNEKKKILITLGGAWSNHIVATAAAAKELNLDAIGIVRGELPKKLSYTLQDAQDFGMQLFFQSRDDYRNKKIPDLLQTLLNDDKAILIPEGGFGEDGVKGAASIASFFDPVHYTHVCCAVGTGAMLTGLHRSLLHSPAEVTGINVLKNNAGPETEIKIIPVAQHSTKPLIIHHNYHFGGYAKYTAELIRFMNDFFTKTNIPSDFVYTGKLFYAVHHLISANYFPAGSKILMIHSGGLQGNRSLKKGTLIY